MAEAMKGLSWVRPATLCLLLGASQECTSYGSASRALFLASAAVSSRNLCLRRGARNLSNIRPARHGLGGAILQECAWRDRRADAHLVCAWGLSSHCPKVGRFFG